MTALNYKTLESAQVHPRYTMSGSTGETLSIFIDRIVFNEQQICFYDLKEACIEDAGTLCFTSKDGEELKFSYENSLRSAFNAKIIISFCRRQLQIEDIESRKKAKLSLLSKLGR